MRDWFLSLDPTVAAAIIAAAVALLTNVLTGVIAYFTPIGSYLIAKLELRDKLRIEYEYEQRKKLRDLIGRYHGRVLQAAEDMNYRIFNLYSNESHGWLEVDTDYEKVGTTRQKYYFQTTVYRFLNLMFIVRRFEEESLYVDSRIAEPMLPPDRPGRQQRRSAAERGLLVQPGELVRVADGVDARDPAVRDHQADRRVELAGEIDPGGGRAVQPHSADHRIRRDRPEAGEEGRH